jgi:rare lipoprotein A
VNDRGPYGPRTRVLDLSKQAARRLSMLRDGVVAVRLEILEMGPH